MTYEQNCKLRSTRTPYKTVKGKGEKYKSLVNMYITKIHIHGAIFVAVKSHSPY